jgi:HlyD family secretion protein
MNEPLRFGLAPAPQRRGRLALAAIGAVIVAAMAWAWLRPREAAPQFVMARADRGDIVARVTATGTLSALVTVQVGTQVSGRIAQINVDYNSPVKKGQLIAKIDPRLFQAAVEQARANLAAAQGNLAQARVKAKDAERQSQRSNELFAQKLIAQADRDTAQANADAAAANVVSAQGALEQARAAAHEAEINLAYTDIVSPTDGVVISKSVDVGQTVAASLQAPVLFTIAQDLRKMEVDTNVAESDVGKLSAGMPVTFTVDAFPAERFRGTVRQVRNAPQTVQNVVTYNAVIDVGNDDLRLRPGMTANVSFTYAQRNAVLRAPNSALRFRPSKELLRSAAAEAPKTDRSPDQRTLWTLRNGQLAALPVKIGVSDGTLTEVVEGELKEGDEVVTDVRGGAADKPSAPSGRLF